VTHGLAIIGTGATDAVHADAIARLPDAELTAVTDVDAGAARAFAAARGCAAEPTLDALPARPDVDVVCVCVPGGLHAGVGLRAATAGKHLAVEKPLDVTLEAAGRLLAAVEEAGTGLTVMSQHRFDPGAAELKRLIDSGALLNQGIHYADLLLWCLGPAAEVTAVTATQAHDIEVEDTALAIVTFASGAVATLSATTAPGALDVAVHAAQLAGLLAAAEAGRPPAVTGAAGRATLALILAVYEAGRTGRPVRMNR
jgi:predicted dehydrogenase